MFAFLGLGRKLITRATAIAGLATLAACDVPVISGNLIDTTRAVPVALLVPQSSGADGARLAKSIENSVRLAIADLGEDVEIELRVYDTAARADVAAFAANKAAEEGARIILGPVFAEAASAAGTTVADRGIPVLSFSNNPDIAGANVFILGTTFDSTAARLARYSVQNGRDNIFIVHAQDPAEEIGSEAIQRGIGSAGGNVAGTASFPLSQQGVVNSIPIIADSARLSGADAIFMTSGTAGALPFLADLLPVNGINPSTTQFIGLQRMDIPSSALSLAGLQNAWFALPDPTTINQFTSRYSANFGAQPHPNAYLGYDAMAAVGALVANGSGNSLTRASLTQSAGFAGAGGIFRLRSDGTNERGLAVAQIQNQRVVVIDPAPRSFRGAGS